MLDSLVWYSSVFTPPDLQSINESLPEWLGKASAQWPDLPSVFFGGECWTYADLARRAAGLALEIRTATTLPGPVALVQSLGFDAVASWFACAIAGRAFLLLEPDQPSARLQELIETAACPLVLCDGVTTKKLADLPQVAKLIPGDHLAAPQPANCLSSSEPAMIFPTSGSEGVPKLVTYSSTTLQVKAQSSRRLMQVPEGARVVIAGSHGNYGFVHHAFVFLLSGGAICLADVRTGGFGSVLRAINESGARHVRFTPSMFRKLAGQPEARSALRELAAVRFSGEPLLSTDLILAKSVLNPECLIQNIYGSTESALFIWSSSDDQLAANAASTPTVPIGRLYPLASCAIIPLDKGAGDESSGELVIRSAFHALGDFKRGGIDQARFPPWPGNPVERTYATGDIVRRLPDGIFIHLGRTGRMIKIRGQRVFPAEIENQLRGLAGVTGAAVIERVETDEPVLYAFITTDASQDLAEAPLQYLAKRLPVFMLPRAVLSVPQLPLMPGGKVDYQRLLRQIPNRPHDNPCGQTPMGNEGRLAKIWDRILWPGAHAQDADFLSLGGDSLKLMALSLEVEREFGRGLPLEEFLADSSLGHLARLLGIARDANAPPKPEGLHVRRVWPGMQPAKGIALAMPGWLGKAPAVVFGRAGLFADHDLWAADYEQSCGTMRDSRRWWKAARSIVEQIRSGAIPPPQIIFGYSFGGGLAWLVSRLLAGTRQRPHFVVIVDAVPIHRHPSFRPRQVSKALAPLWRMEPPPTLHIRRAPIAEGGFAAGSTGLWQKQDQIHMAINLPTIDHLEMTKWEMLTLAREGVEAFFKGQCSDITIQHNVPNLPGARLHQVLSGHQLMPPGELDELMDQTPTSTDVDKLILMLHLAGLSGHGNAVKALIQAAIEAAPQRKLMHYAYFRQKRRTNHLCPNDMPAFLPARLAELDKALSRSKQPSGRLAPRLLRFALLACDLLRAAITARRS
jgi:acyl-coenzyme A synthetase/AMP-(fatty) acid ligase